MAQRANYWSCSKFADWLRGTMKPKAETGHGWRQWQDQARQQHPVRFWLAEEGLDLIQNAIWWPLDQIYDVKYYINNRWVTRTHSLTANPKNIKPGTWRDMGNRFLPCLFDELVNYVEIELAWWHIAWSNKEERSKYNAPFWATGWFRWRTWRCPQAGLDNLEWQQNLVWTEEELGKDHPDVGKPTHQSERAKEILALYRWWTEVYPNRVDPHEASGWTAYCAGLREKNSSIFDSLGDPEEDKTETHRMLDLCNQIEQQYKDEDTEMLIRLIKIRDSLWT